MSDREILAPDFFARPAAEVAPALIGCLLIVRGVGGVVVEAESYGRNDPASHSFNGPTRRNASMFASPGTVYVYRSYGIHLCLNVVCRKGEAVLIRALEPSVGVEAMVRRRKQEALKSLCSGPGKIGQALALSEFDDGAYFDGGDFALYRGEGKQPTSIIAGPRIGLSKAVEQPWRFGLTGSPFLSRRF